MKHVVIIGAGFAGLVAIKQLLKEKNLKITLINQNDYFLFTPRLTELLNESVSRNLVIKDIKQIFGKRVNFIKDKAIFIDFEKKYINTKKSKIDYDFLIMSIGATTNFFNNKNIEKNTIGYKDYDAVLKIKNKINYNIKEASKTNKDGLLTFTVIGGGLTGVEQICSLRETVLKEIKNYSNLNPNDARFIIIQSSKTIVPQLPINVRSKIERFFKNNDIEIMTGIRAEKIEDGIITATNDKIKAATIIWTAGTKANNLKTNPQIKLERGNTIKVTSQLKIPNYNDVYVGGDNALFIENDKPVAATAQTAFQEGVNIGNNIIRRIRGKEEKDFHYSHKGTLIVLGSKNGIFTYKNITIEGKLARYIRGLVYKYKFKQLT